MRSRMSGLTGSALNAALKMNLQNPPVMTMEPKDQVLDAMRKAGEPLAAGKVAELTGLDRKVVDKAFAELKKEGAIVSPVRCKWEPAN